MVSYKIYIGIVSYNDCEGLRKTLKETLPLLHDNLRIIIKDAESIDGTSEVALEAASRSEYIDYVSCPDDGIYSGMNYIIKVVPEDASLIFLGCGDYFIKFNPPRIQSDILFGDCYVGDKFFLSSGSYFKNFVTGNRLHHQSLLIKASILKKFGFREKFPVYADYDLNLRLLRLFKPKRCEVLSYMKPGGVSSRSNIFQIGYVILHHNIFLSTLFFIYCLGKWLRHSFQRSLSFFFYIKNDKR